MKGIAKFFVVFGMLALTVMLPLSAFAAVASPADAAVYVTGEAEVSGKASVTGDIIVAGGEFEGAGEDIHGVVYQASGAEVDAPGAEVLPYEGELVDYAAPDFAEEPDGSVFDGRYQDGREDLLVTDKPNGENAYADGYTLTENANVHTLYVEKDATFNIFAEEGEVRILQVKEFSCAGNIQVVGGGKIIVYVDVFNAGNHSSINNGGDPLSLAFVLRGEEQKVAAEYMAAEIYAKNELKFTGVQFFGNFYTQEDVEFTGKCEVNGLVYAPGQEVRMEGHAVVNGMVIAEDLKLNGGAQINKAETVIPGGEGSEEPEEPEEPEEQPGEPVDKGIKVVKYTPATETFVSGTIAYMKHTPVGHADLVYDVLNADSFVANDDPVPEAVKEDLRLICDTTNDVFEMRSEEVSLYPFGRVDSNAYQYSLTISPYVVPLLNQEDFNSDVHNWLAVGDRNGTVIEVYMIVE